MKRDTSLIIHIGTHKTGTTFIQRSLAEARNGLAVQGISYPHLGAANGHHCLVSLWSDTLKGYATKEGSRNYWSCLQSARGKFDSVVISSEEFSRVHGHNVDYSEVLSFAEGFRSVIFVCFVRNQVDYLQSIFCEVSKIRSPGGPRGFMAHALETGTASGVAVDFNLLLDVVLKDVPRQWIRFVDYSEATRHEGGLIGKLFEVAGLSADAARSVEPAAGGLSNKSAGPLGTWAANTIAPEGNAGWLIDLCDRIARKHLPAGSVLFERQERSAIIEHFAPLNEVFERRVRLVQENFSLTPHEMGKDLPSRSALGVPFWSEVARALYRRAT